MGPAQQLYDQLHLDTVIAIAADGIGLLATLSLCAFFGVSAIGWLLRR